MPAKRKPKKRLAGSGTHYTLALLDQKGNPKATYEFPSVTHILDSVVAKPRLTQWMYKQAILGTSELLSKYGTALPTDPKSLHQLMRDNKLDPTAVRDKAGLHGDELHELVEQLAATGGVPENDDTRGLLSWWQNRGLTPAHILASEVAVVSFKHGYAGTIDLVYRHPVTGKLVMTDIKTGNYIYHTHYLQGEAYKIAWEEAGNPPVEKVSIVHLHDKETDGWGEYVSQDVTAEQWLHIVEIYKGLPKNWHPKEIDFEEE